MGYRNSMSLGCVDMDMTHTLNSTSEVSRYWRIARFGVPPQPEGRKEDGAMLASLGIVPGNGANQWGYEDDPIYDDDW